MYVHKPTLLPRLDISKVYNKVERILLPEERYRKENNSKVSNFPALKIHNKLDPKYDTLP